jgi:hypothetical protein
MGALEALNGMLLFGRTTAILFVIIHRTWPPQLHIGLIQPFIACVL